MNIPSIIWLISLSECVHICACQSDCLRVCTRTLGSLWLGATCQPRSANSSALGRICSPLVLQLSFGWLICGWLILPAHSFVAAAPWERAQREGSERGDGLFFRKSKGQWSGLRGLKIRLHTQTWQMTEVKWHRLFQTGCKLCNCLCSGLSFVLSCLYCVLSCPYVLEWKSDHFPMCESQMTMKKPEPESLGVRLHIQTPALVLLWLWFQSSLRV